MTFVTQKSALLRGKLQSLKKVISNLKKVTLDSPLKTGVFEASILETKVGVRG